MVHMLVMPVTQRCNVAPQEVLTAEEERMNFLKQEAERLRKVEEVCGPTCHDIGTCSTAAGRG
jgi:hypothetical protein